MISIALGFGLWFFAAMVVGAALRWSVAARISAVLSGPALGLAAGVMLLS